MNTATTTLAVYVDTWHKYSYGSTFDKWFDLTGFDDRKDLCEACQTLYVGEQDAELMFQDWEGTPSHFVSKSSIDWNLIVTYKRAEEESRGAAFTIQAEYIGGCNYDTSDDACHSGAKSEGGYVWEMIEDNGLLNEMSEPLHSYFDLGVWACDLLSGGYMFHDDYVFSN